ncbi:unnamed protein product, partial [Didymodactylos carnosus]
ISILQNKLDDEWHENEFEPVLFLWHSSLSENCLEWLNLNNLLNLNKYFPTKSSPKTFQNNNNSTASCLIDEPQSPSITKSLTLTAQQVAHTIIDYERERKAQVLSKSVLSCPICCDDVYGSDCFICYKCTEMACNNCIRKYIESMINEGSVRLICCPLNKQCNIELTPAQISSIVSPTMFHRYDRLLFQSSLDLMEDITYCPRCRHPVIIQSKESKLGECANCYNAFCTLCKRTYHGINHCQLTSVQMLDLYEKYKNGSEKIRADLEKVHGKIFQRLMDDISSMETIKNTAKQCPSCSIFVDKLEGCNKMACGKCHQYFCWTCLRQLPKTNPYSHFNTPGSTCFGKLFEGGEMAW